MARRTSDRSPGPSRAGRPAPEGDRPAAAPRPHARFLELPEDRALREWRRYEGTAQRELFRQLRERFLDRHAVPTGWTIDVGSGPGRFSAHIGGANARRIALDLSPQMLRLGRRLARTSTPGSAVDRVRGDALRPPFAAGSLAEVVAVGNTLGFEGTEGPELLGQLEGLVRPGGVLVLEIAPGPGQRSSYLRRLPVGAVVRLLASPPTLVAARTRREPFSREPRRHREAGFHRWTVAELSARWAARGWSVRETMAVAPALGADPGRLKEIARASRSWAHLLELEEELGREPARWPDAAAVLLAAQRAARITS